MCFCHTRSPKHPNFDKLIFLGFIYTTEYVCYTHICMLSYTYSTYILLAVCVYYEYVCGECVCFMSTCMCAGVAAHADAET